MGNPAARLTDMHVCPMVTPGLPPIPHVGGPVIGPGCPTVLISGLPAAVVGDMCMCVGPPDSIAMGSTGVFIGGKPAARMGDTCAHGGTIVLGCPTVLIGETGSGSGGPSALAPAVAGANPTQTKTIDNSTAAGSAPSQAVGAASQSPATKIKPDSLACTLTDEEGNPMSNVKYEITLPDGSVRKGVTDDQGKVSISGVTPGICQVSFPDIHGGEWG
jgi:uncharacterized Zn-binding protein involved in type VI secretion